MPTSEPSASPSGRTWLVTRKRSFSAMRWESGDQSMLMEDFQPGKFVREGYYKAAGCDQQ